MPQLPPLAFDHKLIVRDSFTQLAKQQDVQRSGVGVAAKAAAPWQMHQMISCMQATLSGAWSKEQRAWQAHGRHPKNEE